jgi:two-component system sensor histidine kinase AlgZ
MTIDRIEITPSGREPLLPAGLWLVYVIGPLPVAVAVVNDLWDGDLAHTLRKVASVFIPFAALVVVFHPLYTLAMPALAARVASPTLRGALHLSVVTVVSVVVSVLVLPLHNLVCGSDLPASHFVPTSVVVSYAIMFPAMLVQAQRNRTRRVERQVVEERQAALRAQLGALQARTSPHFLFNSINTVACLITEDPPLAERTLERLADLFRYALDSGRTSRVPLQTELAMVRDYLEIQQARFGDRLQFSLHADPAVLDVPVPPLLLQPLVENAVVHGFGQRPRGRVEVSARREGCSLVLEVRDDGPGPGASSHHGTQTSVRDLGERLRLAFGEGAQLALQHLPQGGCLARVAMPVT